MAFLTAIVLILAFTATKGYMESRMMTVIPVNTSPRLDESAVFICHIDEPAKACYIKAPNALEWTIYNSTSYLDKIEDINKKNSYGSSYYGDGINTGDCGVVIVKPTPDINGVWKCKLTAAEDDRDFVAPISIMVQGKGSESQGVADDGQKSQEEEEEEENSSEVLDELYDEFESNENSDQSKEKLEAVEKLDEEEVEAEVFVNFSDIEKETEEQPNLEEEKEYAEEEEDAEDEKSEEINISEGKELKQPNIHISIEMSNSVDEVQADKSSAPLEEQEDEDMQYDAQQEKEDLQYDAQQENSIQSENSLLNLAAVKSSAPLEEQEDEDMQYDAQQEKEDLQYDEQQENSIQSENSLLNLAGNEGGDKTLAIVVFLSLVVFGAMLFALLVTVMRFKYNKKSPPFTDGNFYKRLAPDLDYPSKKKTMEV